MSNLRPPSLARAFVLGALAFFVVAFVTVELAFWLRPTLVHGHKHMALGHAMLAPMTVSVAGIAVLVVDFRWQRRHRRSR